MVRAASVRPGGRLVRQAVEVQVSVLEPVGEALISIRGLGGRHPVDQHGPVALLEAVAVGVLAQRAAGRVSSRTGLRATGPLRFRVLAGGPGTRALTGIGRAFRPAHAGVIDGGRSEEHTSELQSLTNLVCRLLLEKRIFRLIGDGVTEDLSLILTRIYDGSPAPLRMLIEAANADEYARNAALDAL